MKHTKHLALAAASLVAIGCGQAAPIAHLAPQAATAMRAAAATAPIPVEPGESFRQFSVVSDESQTFWERVQAFQAGHPTEPQLVKYIGIAKRDFGDDTQYFIQARVAKEGGGTEINWLTYTMDAAGAVKRVHDTYPMPEMERVRVGAVKPLMVTGDVAKELKRQFPVLNGYSTVIDKVDAQDLTPATGDAGQYSRLWVYYHQGPNGFPSNVLAEASWDKTHKLVRLAPGLNHFARTTPQTK